MRTDKKENHVILGDEREDIANFAQYLEYIVPQHYEKENLVIDLLV